MGLYLLKTPRNPALFLKPEKRGEVCANNLAEQGCGRRTVDVHRNATAKEKIMNSTHIVRDNDQNPAAVELAAAWSEDPFSHLTVPMD